MVDCKNCKNCFQVLISNESNKINFCKIPHKSKDKYKIYEIDHEAFNDSNIGCTEFQVVRKNCNTCKFELNSRHATPCFMCVLSNEWIGL